MLVSIEILTEPIVLLVIMEILTEQYTQGVKRGLVQCL